MGWTLAITGKGGVGKTTLAALAVRYLSQHGLVPVLAVDADPNTNLDALLGVHVDTAVGTVREDVRKITLTRTTSVGGMGKQQMLEMKILESLIESERFDLLAMGRPEGPGCYCYANNILREAIRKLADDYKAVVIDNEAGLENLSRRIVRRVHELLFVTDPSLRGLLTARRLYDLAVEMEVEATSMSVVINRARDDQCLGRARELFRGTRVAIAGIVPENDELGSRDAAGEPIFTLSPENPVYLAAGEVFARMTPTIER